MKHAELEQYKGILRALLASLEHPFRRRGEMAVENVPDMLDRIQQAGERELTIRQIESDFSRVQSLMFALERIGDGTYGRCLRCEGEIGSKRLHALPWAACCVKCQEIVDRERGESAPGELIPAMQSSDAS